ncbi:MAG: hypothetical protein J6Z23_02985 [Lachnospiraceae bacterium]|nr:hypothetical protein [Lachnospiraceae bacterium]
MNQENLYVNDGGDNTSLYDIFFYVLRHWRVLIILMVVFAVLLGGVKGFSSARERAASLEAHRAWDAKTDEEKSARGVTEPEVIPASDVVKDTLRFTLVGLFAGLFAGAAFFAVRFCLMPPVTNALYIQGRYGLNTFGVLPETGSRSRRGGLDRWIMNKAAFRKDLSIEDSSKLIAANVNKKLGDAAIVLLAGTVPQAQLKRVQKALHGRVTPELVVAGDLNSEADAVQALTPGIPVIIVEQIHKSRQAYMDFEMNTLRESGAQAAGVILME